MITSRSHEVPPADGGRTEPADTVVDEATPPATKLVDPELLREWRNALAGRSLFSEPLATLESGGATPSEAVDPEDHPASIRLAS